MRALLRYAPWHLLEIVSYRGLAMALVGTFFAFTASQGIRPDTPDARVAMGLGALLRDLTIFFSMIAVGNVIYADRHDGYFRFLFSKPLNPVGYYIQAFILGGVAVALAVLFTWGAFAVLERPVVPTANVAKLAATFLGVATLTFVFSRFTRLDWLLGWVIFGLAAPLREAYPKGESLGGTILHYLLPPAHLLREAALGFGDWLWLFGYPLLVLAATLAIVRWRPLGGAA